MESVKFNFPWFDRRVWAVGGVLFLILATAFVGLRTYRNYAEPSREFDWGSRGMSDFYTFYTYSKAFRDGVNPYSMEVMEHPDYVVPRNAAPFSPAAFLPYVALTFVSLNVASVIFFMFNWLLLGVLAWCCISMSRIKFDPVLWVWVFGFLVFSRPGHLTMFTGYVTAVLAIGTIVALHFSKSKPLLSGFGFLLAAVKPTYAIPLTLLMLARRDFKATVIGCVLTIGFAVGCFAWLSSHSDVASVIDGIKSGQEAFHNDTTEEPFNTWTRVDVPALIAKFMHRVPGTVEYLGVMLVLLIVPCLAIWRCSGREVVHDEIEKGAASLTAVVAVLALLVTIYHHSYDCLVVSVAMVSMLLHGSQLKTGLPRFVSLCIGVLLAIPMINYASTRAFRDRLGFEQSDSIWQLITMSNGICLGLALLIAMLFALKTKTAIQSESDSS